MANITGFCDCACEKEQEYNSTNVVTMATLLVVDLLVLKDRKEMTVLALLLIEQIEPIEGVLNPCVVGDACECSNYECDTGSNGLVCSGRGNCTCLVASWCNLTDDVKACPMMTSLCVIELSLV